MPALPENIFYDFSKLPPERGILFFPLSISKLRHRQNAQNCIQDLYNFTPSKITKTLVGVNFVYGDFLYLHSDAPSHELKETFMNQIIEHKNATQKIVKKNQIDFQIQHAFSFMVWNQLYLGTLDFGQRFDDIKKIYKEDPLFQKYMEEDCKRYERDTDDNQVNFFLEEALMFYFINKGKVKLINEYVDNNQKWILICYPGRPLKTTVYLFHLDAFTWDWPENPYQNAFYDLEQKKLYEFDRLNLETWNYE